MRKVDERVFYVGAFVSSALYSYALEKMNKRFEPDLTWLTVMGGVALTGSWKGALTRWGDTPARDPKAMQWRTDWQWVGMFAASGVPVISWQIWQGQQRKRRLMRYILGE